MYPLNLRRTHFPNEHYLCVLRLIEVCLAVCNGTLEKITLEWDPRPAVCVVMASGGYPGEYEKGKVITGIEDAEEKIRQLEGQE